MTKSVQKLIKDHPILQNVKCGVDVPIGWIPIVDKLASRLESRETGLKVQQIKQKFGQLTVYLNVTPVGQILEIITEAELEASRTCEVCGGHGALVQIDMFWTVRCENHKNRHYRVLET